MAQACESAPQSADTQPCVARVTIVVADAASSVALRSAFLCALSLLCLEALVSHFAYRRGSQEYEETHPVCPTGFGAGRPATATVRAFSGKLHRTATLVAVWFLLLLRWTCEACVIVVIGCRHVVLSLERRARTFQFAVLCFLWHDICRHG